MVALLREGNFDFVTKCCNTETAKVEAIKVSKRYPDIVCQAKLEIAILKLLTTAPSHLTSIGIVQRFRRFKTPEEFAYEPGNQVAETRGIRLKCQQLMVMDGGQQSKGCCPDQCLWSAPANTCIEEDTDKETP